MIFRIFAETKKKDVARSILEKYFDKYFVYNVDRYTGSNKDLAFVFEVESSEIDGAYKAAKEMSKLLEKPVSLQTFNVNNFIAGKE